MLLVPNVCAYILYVFTLNILITGNFCYHEDVNYLIFTDQILQNGYTMFIPTRNCFIPSI